MARRAKRRQNLPWQAVERIAEVFLGPRARPEQHPEAFYKGMRLVGIDGSKFSVCNLPALTTTLGKAISRRLKAAFAKIGVVTLVELGLHNPIAVKVGANGESEAVLAKQLLAGLKDCLYLADRLYGNACVVALSLAQKAVSGVEFLLRVSGRPKPPLIETLKDGSALVEIKHGKQKMIVREIRGRLRKRNGKWTTVRLWTSLLDASRYPARELLQLYGRRWEHEITYKELKRELRDSVLLNAHTVETARQEIVALVMAQSMVSKLRQLVAETGQIAVLEVSFPQDTAHGASPVVCAVGG